MPKQSPFAAVLGCSDARVPIELVFNEGPNDLFVVRVAGNGIGSDVLGSLRYTIEHLRDSLRLVVVLGHSGCGAISTAVDMFMEPAGYTMQEELGRPASGRIRAVYGVYLLGSRAVWAPAGHAGEVTGLAEPPRILASFSEFGEAVAASDRISSMLSPR